MCCWPFRGPLIPRCTRPRPTRPRPTRRERRRPAPAASPRAPPASSLISIRPRNEQTLSPLFSSRFPGELRLAIYEAVLGDPHRLMHIIPFDDHSERLGRQRCKEPGCLYPTWQHTCFGSWLEKDGSVLMVKTQFFSRDHFLALLICCRRVYFEAIDVLYTANHFSFKGTRGLLLMKSIVPVPHWHSIRHLNISTMFLAPSRMWGFSSDFPPEDYRRWAEGCRALQDMRNLRSLHFDIIVWYGIHPGDLSAVDSLSILQILQPLQYLHAPTFVVELNLPMPEEVSMELGEFSFTFVVKQRPYNMIAFPV